MKHDFLSYNSKLGKSMSNNGSSEKSSVQNQILLMKLSDAYNSAPRLKGGYVGNEYSEVQKWIARAGALIDRADAYTGTFFKTRASALQGNWNSNMLDMHQMLLNTIEKIKIDLEINGRDTIGQVYESGQAYDFFKDITSIISRASKEIFIIDPYFDTTAFGAYLEGIKPEIKVKVLCSRYSKDLAACIRSFNLQTGSAVEIRKSKELHDRVIFIDKSDCLVVGASIKDGGKDPTFIVPLMPQLTTKKLEIYEGIWTQAVDPLVALPSS